MPDRPDKTPEQDSVSGDITAIEEAADAAARLAEADEPPKKANQSQLPHHLTPEERAEAEKQRQAGADTAKRRPWRPSKKQLIAGAVLLVALLIAAWFVPASRNLALNLMGVRGSLEIASQDEASGQGSPRATIKRFLVQIDGKTYDSGQADKLTISGLRFGRYQVTVSKQGYSSYQTTAEVSFNPLFGFLMKRQTSPVVASLKAVGTPVSFMARDWVSGLPITAGQYVVADRAVTPDASGKVTVIAPPADNNQVSVTATFASDFTGKTFTLPITGPPQNVSFVPSARDYFVSNRDGGYGIYSSQLDGGDVKLLVKSSPNDNNKFEFSVSPSGKYGVMVSGREGVKDPTNAYTIGKVYKVDLTSGAYQKIDEGGLFTNIVGWSGDWLTYSYSYYPDKSNSTNTRVATYNLSTGRMNEIYNGRGSVSTTYLADNGVLMSEIPPYMPGVNQSGRTIYWAPSGGPVRSLASGVDQLVRTDFNRFAYGGRAGGAWSEFNSDSNQIRQVAQPPVSGITFWPAVSGGGDRVFSQIIDSRLTLSVRQPDGKDRQLARLSASWGLGNLRFADSTNLVYSAFSPGGVWSDYVLSLRGGEPRKITDISAPYNDYYSVN
ncbi:MAG: hypothetical protein EOT04_00910 [Candidatus Chaera renei]|uniref:PEGA domain-containing protein n=1 Tax=Candidatus Chaera renei TaxID=2506947 RepID=A0A4Q0AJS0_9BACT|nr:MAG: hypothetical protein EOT04_00910 [Candidatus Chaera renei]